MLPAQKLAIAAHMHVLLRRKTGRVTDTEWMAENPDYAREVVRFARAKAIEENAPELAESAARLEEAVLGGASPQRPRAPAAGSQSALDRLRERSRSAVIQPARAPVAERTGGFAASLFGHARADDPPDSGLEPKRDPKAPRYVGGLR